ncbi:hypothetical protein [Thaumasiovibrio sp. DFM-14]|uniref:defense against restriction DarA-related protein n=1 Tax=Thaumasiovibrio sp. DFM-14 TaxID=3384792 RepID=UPI0039A38966
MTNRSNSKSQYATVDFDNVTPRGLSKLTSALGRTGHKVADVEASNRRIRRDSLFVKRAILTIDGGQRAELVIGDQGDIFQVRINGKAHPIPESKNVSTFARNLGKALDRTLPAFEKSQARKMKKPKATARTRPASRTLKARAQEAQDRLGTLRDGRDQLAAQLAKSEAALTEVTTELNQKTVRKNEINLDNKELKQQITNALEAQK